MLKQVIARSDFTLERIDYYWYTSKWAFFIFSAIDNVDYHDIQLNSTNDERKSKILPIISNPIHIYNLIKEILLFSNEIYPLLSETNENSGAS